MVRNGKIMKDAFGKPMSVGDKVIYATGSGSGTCYHQGMISKLYLSKNGSKSYSPPDRVSIQVIKSSRKTTFSKEPVVYASNVVLLPIE